MKKIVPWVLSCLLWATVAFASGPVPPVNTDMGCSAAGQPLYYNGSALACGSPGTITAGGIVITGGTAPTIAAGAGAGTTPTLAITGALNSQLVSITTGTCTVSCTGSAVIATVTLPISCPATVVPTITPGNANAAQLSGSGSVWTIGTAVNTYTFNSSSTGLLPATLYNWNVSVGCW